MAKEIAYDYEKLDFKPTIKAAAIIQLRNGNKFYPRTKEQLMKSVAAGYQDKKLHLWFTSDSIIKAVKSASTATKVAESKTTAKTDK